MDLIAISEAFYTLSAAGAGVMCFGSSALTLAGFGATSSMTEGGRKLAAGSWATAAAAIPAVMLIGM